MRVIHNPQTEEIIIRFDLCHREMAKLIIEDAIDRYRDAGFDVSEICSVLWGIWLTDNHLH